MSAETSHGRQPYHRLDSTREETEIEMSNSNSNSNSPSTNSRSSTPTGEQPTKSSPRLTALGSLQRAIGYLTQLLHDPSFKYSLFSKTDSESSKSTTNLASQSQETIVMQAEPRHASFRGYCEDAPAHSTQHKPQIGLGERLKKAWRSALPAREICVCCNEEIQTTRIVLGSCGHKYCHKCIKRMVRVAMEDKSKFPVKCCAQEIPEKRVASALNVRNRKIYLAQRVEYEVPPSERWYCPHPNCCRWIHPRNLTTRSKPLKCPHCRSAICINCRDLAHGDRECVFDDTLRDILALARRNHWQRCYRCHALVEKTSGCTHMRCSCNAEFCYVCGDKYRACNCRGTEVVHDTPQFEEDGDLDIDTVVAAMEQAEREEEEEQ